MVLSVMMNVEHSILNFVGKIKHVHDTGMVENILKSFSKHG